MEQAFARLVERAGGQKLQLSPPPQRDLYTCAMYLHQKLGESRVDYYFCGGFACINVGMTARTTADIDIVVPNGESGYGTLLNIFRDGPFMEYKGSYYFFVNESGNFVEVDGVIAGWMAFPKLTEAEIIPAGPTMQLNFLEPAGLLKLKLSSWASDSRRKSSKRTGDMSDIISIRTLLIETGKKMDLSKLDGDMKKGLKLWIGEFNDRDTWKMLEDGLGSSSSCCYQ